MKKEGHDPMFACSVCGGFDWYQCRAHFTARIRELEAALTPFAVAGTLYVKQGETDGSIWARFPDDRLMTVRLGELRRAAIAMEARP